MMPLQVVQLLVPDRDLSVPVRAALAEGRLEQAGFMLMDEYDLTCEEAGALVDLVLCEAHGVTPRDTVSRSGGDRSGGEDGCA